MLRPHNLTLDEIYIEIEHQDNELAKAVFDRGIPEAERAGRVKGLEESMDILQDAPELLDRVQDLIQELAETLGGGEMDLLIQIQDLVGKVERDLKSVMEIPYE